MPEIINCPGCQRKLQVQENLLGQQVQCPTCQKMFTATAGTDLPPPFPQEQPFPPSGEPDEPRRAPRRRRYEEEADEEDYEEERYYRQRRRDLQPHRGSMILTVGIVSLVFLPCFFPVSLILGPIAWVMGSTDLADIQANRMDPEGEGQTNAGKICGMIATILSLLALCAIGLAVFIRATQDPRGFR
jgi:hypothetical protein